MKKGFTLIELLAVIVILAVLALIATPIVLNIIDDSKKNATLRSSENYIKAIEFSIAKSVMENKRLSDGTYPIMSNGSICLGTLTGTNCSDTLVVEVAGETPESGTVTIKSRKIDSYEFTYKSGFVVVNGEINSGGVNICKLTIDENSNGEADAGDMVVCSGDNFYVVPNDSVAHSSATTDAITLMVEYPITPTNSPEQKQNAAFVSFSESVYWGIYEDDYINFNLLPVYEEKNYFVYDSNSNLYQYIEAYKQKLKKAGINVLESSVLSYEQWQNVWNLRTNNLYKNIEFEAFWLGNYYYFSDGMETSVLWYDPVLDTSYDYAHDHEAGSIRPVIIISKDSIQ